MKGLIIQSPWIDLIFEGKKIWEIRGSNIRIRGTIALIKSGTGHIYGTVELVQSKNLTLQEYQKSEAYHQVSSYNCEKTPYKNTYAWVLRNPKRYVEPIPYKHPMGAVIWVKLD